MYANALSSQPSLTLPPHPTTDSGRYSDIEMGRNADRSRSRRSSNRLRTSLDDGKGSPLDDQQQEHGRPSLGLEGAAPEDDGFYPPEDDMMMDMDNEGPMLGDLPPPPPEGEEEESVGSARKRPGSSLSLGLGVGLDSVLEEGADQEGPQGSDAEEPPPEPVKKRRKTRKPVS